MGSRYHPLPASPRHPPSLRRHPSFVDPTLSLLHSLLRPEYIDSRVTDFSPDRPPIFRGSLPIVDPIHLHHIRSGRRLSFSQARSLRAPLPGGRRRVRSPEGVPQRGGGPH